MTVGDLKKRIQGLDDSLPVCVLVTNPNPNNWEERDYTEIWTAGGLYADNCVLVEAELAFKETNKYMNVDGEQVSGSMIALHI